MREPSTSAVPDHPLPRSWDEVEIRFVSDFTFQAVVNGRVRAPQNYAEVGLGDGRHGRPKAAWETLRALAESGGVVASTRTAADWPRLEKRIQEIRRVLQAVFKVPDDPDSLPRRRLSDAIHHPGRRRPTTADRRSGEISPAPSNFFFAPTSLIRSAGSETFRRRKVVGSAKFRPVFYRTEHFSFRGGPHDTARAP